MTNRQQLGELFVEVTAELDKFNRDIQGAESRLTSIGSKFQSVGSQMSSVGRNMTTAITVPLAGIGIAAFKAASDFESSFAGVRKTVQGSEADFKLLEDGFRNMAKEIPVSVNELNRIGEAAGQLGIDKENILDFTRVMADLGVTTNLSSDQAASALARLANITGMPQTEFDRLGSTVVALGNNFATTEAEIVEMGLRLAGAGHQIGLSEAEILSFATALSSVGIEAEAGGTAFSRVMIEMAQAVNEGGEELDAFAGVAQMSASEFATAFRDDPAQAIAFFISGLGEIQQNGGDTFGVLEDLGLSEIRVRDALLRASGASGLFTDALKVGSAAWEENTALTNEAEQRYGTTASQIQLLKNQFMDAAITLGQALIPAFLELVKASEPLLDIVVKLAEWFSNLPQPVQTAIAGFAALIAVIGPLLLIGGSLVSAIGGIITAFSILGPAIAAAGGVLLTFATGPVGIIIAALVAIGVAAYLLWRNWDTVWNFIKNATASVVNFLQNSPFRWLLLALGPAGVLALAIGFFSKHWETIWNGIKTVTQTVVNAIRAIFDPFIAFFKTVFTPVFTELRNIWNVLWNDIRTNVSNNITTIRNIVQTLVDFFRNVFEAYFNALRTFWTTVWNVIRTVTETAINAIRTIIQTLVNVLGPVLRPVLEALRTVWTAVFNAIRTVTVTVVNAIINGPVQFLRNVFEAVLPHAIQLFQTLWRTGWDMILAVLRTVVAAITGGPVAALRMLIGPSGPIAVALRGLQQVWGIVWNAIRDVTQVVIDAIRNVVTSGMSLVQNVITTALNVIRSVWTSGWNTIRSITQTVWDAIRSITQSVTSTIRSVITSFISTITSAITNGMNTLRNIWDTAWQALLVMVNTITSVIRGVIQSFAGFIGPSGPLAGAVNALRGAWQSAWDAIVGIVRNAVGAITGAIQSVFGVIDNLVGKIGGAVEKIGGFLGKIRDIPGNVGGLLSKIPGFAMGGIVTGPTLAMVGEREPEAIIPLSKLRDIITDTAKIGAVGLGSGDGTQINVTQHFHGPTSPAEQARQQAKAMRRLALEGSFIQ